MQHTRIGAAFLLIALPLAALAQTAPAPQSAAPPSAALKEARMKMRAACAGDVQKLCANVERAKGALGSCMREHRAELSAACTSARDDVRAIRLKEKG